MDSKDIKEAIDFAADPNTRAAFVSGFTAALILGYSAGIISCKALYGLVHMIVSVFRNRFLRKERQREAERQRKEEAAKRRLEAWERRKNEKREVHAILWDRNGTPYCPVCGRALKPFVKDQTRKHSVSYCYGCRTHMICDTLTLEEEVRKKWEQ